MTEPSYNHALCMYIYNTYLIAYNYVPHLACIDSDAEGGIDIPYCLRSTFLPLSSYVVAQVRLHPCLPALNLTLMQSKLLELGI